MIINKSRDESLKYVRLYLHGQLYVALSRVTSNKGLKILITDDEGQDTSFS